MHCVPALLHMILSLQSINLSPTSLWQKLLEIKDGINKLKFEVLSNFMCGLPAPPHSSACVEKQNKQTDSMLAQLPIEYWPNNL